MISIIVPIYNVAPYLRQCIESILGQTYQELEVLLIDDGSTDGCYEICEEYKRRDLRITVIHKENGGIVSARKAGLRAARGEYIAYVDGDDWIEPDMYAHMLETLQQENVDLVMCGRYEDTGRTSKPVFHGIQAGCYRKPGMVQEIYPRMIAGRRFFEWGIFPNVWDKLFRRDCVYPYQMQVDDAVVMGEDAACTYPCLLHAKSLYILDECLYHYRQRAASMVKDTRYDAQGYKRYEILYRSVLRSFSRSRHMYDLRKQWEQYMLFLLVPRADCFYRGAEKLDYLFPFPKVRKGSRIILYCAGTYGQRLWKYLRDTGFCTVAAWVDRDFTELNRQGFPVETPKVIAKREYDAIVIANMFAGAREEIYRECMSRYPGSRVYGVDENLVTSKETMQAFGLL